MQNAIVTHFYNQIKNKSYIQQSKAKQLIINNDVIEYFDLWICIILVVNHESNENIILLLQPIISFLNQLHTNNEQEPFLPWVLQHTFNTMPETIDPVIKIFQTLHRLNIGFFDAAFIYKNKRVSLLTYMSQCSQPQIIPCLIEKIGLKFDRNDTNHPIVVAFEAQQKAIATYLIQTLSIYNPEYSLLKVAIKYSEKSIFEQIISIDANNINQCDTSDQTPLMHAVCYGKIDIIQSLLDAGADRYTKNSKDQTVFHKVFKCKQKDFEAVRQLIDPTNTILCSDNIEHRDINKQTPIHYAIYYQQTDWIKKVCSEHNGLHALIDNASLMLAMHAIKIDSFELFKSTIQENNASMHGQRKQKLMQQCILQQRFNFLIWLYQLSIISENIWQECLLFAIKNKKTDVIRLFLTHKEIKQLFFTKPAALKPLFFNLSLALCENQQQQFIVELDLYTKDSQQLFEQDANDNLTSLDKCIKMFEKNPEKNINVLNYVVNFLKKNKKLPSSISQLKYYRAFILLGLREKLIDINDKLSDNEPIFHTWERTLYEEFIQAEPGAAYQAEYTFHLKALCTYKPDLNKKDNKGEHLFAKLIRSSGNTQRIQYLFNTFPRFQLTQLNNQNFSLLQLACQYQNVAIMEWCFNKRMHVFGRKYKTLISDISNLHNTLFEIIEHNHTSTLQFYLQQEAIQPYLQSHGFWLLYQAYRLKRDNLLLILLQNETISVTVADHENQLLFEAAKDGRTAIVLKLLTFSSVIQKANIGENDVLRAATNAEDFNACEALLMIPCIIETLRANNYAFVREMIEHNQDELIALINKHVPDTKNLTMLNEPKLQTRGVSQLSIFQPNIPQASIPIKPFTNSHPSSH